MRSSLKLIAVILVLVSISACQRNHFDYADTAASPDAPKYTVNPQVNKPVEQK